MLQRLVISAKGNSRLYNVFSKYMYMYIYYDYKNSKLVTWNEELVATVVHVTLHVT